MKSRSVIKLLASCLILLFLADGCTVTHNIDNNYEYMEVEPRVKEGEKMVERRETAGNVEAEYGDLFKLYVGKLRPAAFDNRKRRLRSISPETPSSHPSGVGH